MKVGRVLCGLAAVILTLCLQIDAKVFRRCELTRELLKMHFSRTFISNWVCLVEKESNKNTSAVYEKSSRKKYYGLFHIGNEWCKEGKKGGKCNIECESLIDDDIVDDAECAQHVFNQEGFKYWSKWEKQCKGHPLPDVERCPDWRYPTPPRSLPSRSKRAKKQITRIFKFW